MIKFVLGGCLAISSLCASAEGINLFCDEYRVVVEPGGLTVNSRHYLNPQEQPYEISEQYRGRSLMYIDSTDQDSDSNWAAIHIITQIATGKKAFFFSDNNHKDEKAIICSREEQGVRR